MLPTATRLGSNTTSPACREIGEKLAQNPDVRELFVWLKSPNENGGSRFVSLALQNPCNLGEIWGRLDESRKVELLKTPYKKGEEGSVLSALVMGGGTKKRSGKERREKAELIGSLVGDVAIPAKTREILVRGQLERTTQWKDPAVLKLVASLDPEARSRILINDPFLFKNIVDCGEGEVLSFMLEGLPSKDLEVLLSLLVPGEEERTFFSYIAEKAQDVVFDQVCTRVWLEAFKSFAELTIVPLNLIQRKKAALSVLRNIGRLLPEAERLLFCVRQNNEGQSLRSLILYSYDPALLEGLFSVFPRELHEDLLKGVDGLNRIIISVVLSSGNKRFLLALFSLLNEKTLFNLLKQDKSERFFLQGASLFLVGVIKESVSKGILSREFMGKMCISSSGSLLRIFIKNQWCLCVSELLKLFSEQERTVLLREVAPETGSNSGLDELNRFPNPDMARLLKSFGAVFSGSVEAPFTREQARAVCEHRLRPNRGTCLDHYPLITLGSLFSKQLLPFVSIAQNAFSCAFGNFFLDASVLAEHVRKGGMAQILITGFAGHQVAVVLGNHLMAFCDRSYFMTTMGGGGIEVFTIHNPAALESAIVALRRARFLDKGDALPEIEVMKQQLMLAPLSLSDDMRSYLTTKPQIKPNCVNASLKAALRVLLVWSFLTQERKETAEELIEAKKYYKGMTREDRARADRFLQGNP